MTALFLTYKLSDYEKESNKYVNWSFDVFINDGHAAHPVGHCETK